MRAFATPPLLCLRNDLYCVEWGVKLCSNQPATHVVRSVCLCSDTRVSLYGKTDGSATGGRTIAVCVSGNPPGQTLVIATVSIVAFEFDETLHRFIGATVSVWLTFVSNRRTDHATSATVGRIFMLHIICDAAYKQRRCLRLRRYYRGNPRENRGNRETFCEFTAVITGMGTALTGIPR